MAAVERFEEMNGTTWESVFRLSVTEARDQLQSLLHEMDNVHLRFGRGSRG